MEEEVTGKEARSEALNKCKEKRSKKKPEGER